MFIELEAPSKEKRTDALYVGPFADEAAARAAIQAAPNVAWEPVRSVTGNGSTLMARAISGRRTRRIPTVPAIPVDRDEFAIVHYQYS